LRGCNPALASFHFRSRGCPRPGCSVDTASPFLLVPITNDSLGLILFSSMDIALEPQFFPFLNAIVAFRIISYKFFASAAPEIKLFRKKSGNKVIRYLV